MAVRIRLSRCGRKNRPHYRIAVYDSNTRRDGRYLELLGHYDPLTHDPKAKIKLEAERLTGSLENAGSVAPLHVLNMAGRQRMLSQRFAKYALLGVLGDAFGISRAYIMVPVLILIAYLTVQFVPSHVEEEVEL